MQQGILCGLAFISKSGRLQLCSALGKAWQTAEIKKIRAYGTVSELGIFLGGGRRFEYLMFDLRRRTTDREGFGCYASMPKIIKLIWPLLEYLFKLYDQMITGEKANGTLFEAEAPVKKRRK